MAMTHGMAGEPDSGIRVNSVCPSMIVSDSRNCLAILSAGR